MEKFSDLELFIMKFWRDWCTYLGKQMNECNEKCLDYKACRKLKKLFEEKKECRINKQLLTLWYYLCRDNSDCNRCSLKESCKKLVHRLKIKYIPIKNIELI